jgi:glutathione S-transferase
MPSQKAYSWEVLEQSATWTTDYADGPLSSQSRLRLFGKTAADVRVTFYRDCHSWCPYCQKVWIFLEENKIPYRVEKVTMNFYGEKQQSFLDKVPSGKVPAVEIHGKPGQKFPWLTPNGQDQIVTESDEIISVLEKAFQPLANGSIHDIISLRDLERKLFKAWCEWLCHPSEGSYDNKAISAAERTFRAELATVAGLLSSTPGCFFLEDFSVADIIFAPFLERMLASLYYYKGFDLKKEHAPIARWFKAMEGRDAYHGTMSDFQTTVNVLPPSMGGCFEEGGEIQKNCAKAVRLFAYGELPESSLPEPPTSVAEAVNRMIRHKEAMIARDPLSDDKKAFDTAIRCALTTMITGKAVKPPTGTAAPLRHIRDRVSVPRDMSVWAARRVRAALEATAKMDSSASPHSIDTTHRYDQDPKPFLICQWDLGKVARRPEDVDHAAQPLPNPMKRLGSSSSDSTASGSGGSEQSKISTLSTVSGWDEDVLKNNRSDAMLIKESNAKTPAKGRTSFFQSLFGWGQCACTN